MLARRMPVVVAVAAAVSEDGTGTTERPSVPNPLSKHPHPNPSPIAMGEGLCGCQEVTRTPCQGGLEEVVGGELTELTELPGY
jgi:hypothetical protein